TRKYVSSSSSPPTNDRGLQSVVIVRASPFGARGRTDWPAAILPGQGLQELDDEVDLLGVERPSELDPRHRVDGLLQRGRAAVVKVRPGHRDVAEARHPEHAAVTRDPGDVKAPQVAIRLLEVPVRKDPEELVEHVSADVDSLVTCHAPVRLEELVPALLRFG